MKLHKAMKSILIVSLQHEKMLNVSGDWWETDQILIAFQRKETMVPLLLREPQAASKQCVYRLQVARSLLTKIHLVAAIWRK